MRRPRGRWQPAASVAHLPAAAGRQRRRSWSCAERLSRRRCWRRETRRSSSWASTTVSATASRSTSSCPVRPATPRRWPYLPRACQRRCVDRGSPLSPSSGPGLQLTLAVAVPLATLRQPGSQRTHSTWPMVMDAVSAAGRSGCVPLTDRVTGAASRDACQAALEGLRNGTRASVRPIRHRRGQRRSTLTSVNFRPCAGM
jgi:hypothetical protein